MSGYYKIKYECMDGATITAERDGDEAPDAWWDLLADLVKLYARTHDIGCLPVKLISIKDIHGVQVV